MHATLSIRSHTPIVKDLSRTGFSLSVFGETARLMQLQDENRQAEARPTIPPTRVLHLRSAR
jgi:hypothetical protein